MKKYIIPIIIPYSQDKKDWVLENQKIKQENIKEFTVEKVDAFIKKELKKVENEEYVELAFLGADFTDLEEGLQEKMLENAQKYIRSKRVDGIRVLIRPDNVTKEKLKMLKKYKVKSIEMQVYSTSEYILSKIGMRFDLNDIKRASRMIKFRGFKLGYQIMIGLPESTKIDDINTAKNLIKLKAKFISINPVLVIKNTELEKEYNQNEYKPLAVVQAIETCKELVKIFNKKNIEISAIGFEPIDTEVKQEIFSDVVITGPFHPAFRQLVESSLWYDVIVNKIKKLNAKVMEVEITVNPVDINNVIGYKNENIDKFKNTYDVDLIVTSSENIKQGKSKIEITKVFDL